MCSDFSIIPTFCRYISSVYASYGVQEEGRQGIARELDARLHREGRGDREN